MRLIASWELPKGVGLIEYNKYKFECRESEYGKFWLRGLRVVKKAHYRKIPQHIIDNAIKGILRRSEHKLYRVIAKSSVSRRAREISANHLLAPLSL